LVGDTLNLSQSPQQAALADEAVVSGVTLDALSTPIVTVPVPPQLVKGRGTPVIAYNIDSPVTSTST
jgi:hypothetical protein